MQPPQITPLRIGFVGDVMLGRLVDEYLPEQNYQHPWGNTLFLLQSTHLNIANLETTLTTSENRLPKIFNFKAKPIRACLLKEANIKIANLANNHILDFGTQGLSETITHLRKQEIHPVGAGKNLSEATRPALITLNGITLAIVGITDNEPTWAATPTASGVNYTKFNKKTAQILTPMIQTLKERCDILILSLHWGPNMSERPPQDFKEFAHFVIDSGVDILHGHSAHLFQGIEIYKNKIILYDTGDFIDDYAVDPVLRNDRSFFFVAELEKKKIKTIHLYPTLITQFCVNLSKREDFEETIQKMELLCKELGTITMKTKEGLKIIL